MFMKKLAVIILALAAWQCGKWGTNTVPLVASIGALDTFKSHQFAIGHGTRSDEVRSTLEPVVVLASDFDWARLEVSPRDTFDLIVRAAGETTKFLRPTMTVAFRDFSNIERSVIVDSGWRDYIFDDMVTGGQPVYFSFVGDYWDDETGEDVNLLIKTVSFVVKNKQANRRLTLQWSANTEADLMGYNIYYGLASKNYINKTVVGRSTLSYYFVDTDLVIGMTYYFAVTAFDTAGNESGFSNEVSGILVDVDPSPCDLVNCDVNDDGTADIVDWIAFKRTFGLSAGHVYYNSRANFVNSGASVGKIDGDDLAAWGRCCSEAETKPPK